MSLLRGTAAATLGALLFVATPAFAQASDSSVLTPEHVAQRYADREAIEALMWNYDRALDTYDVDAYVNSFTPDGAFGQVKGRDALREMLVGIKQSQEERRADGETLGEMRHFTMNQYLEFVDETHARYHYYHQTVFGSSASGGSPPVVAAAGNGVDDLVKVDGKWLIQSRNVAATPEND